MRQVIEIKDAVGMKKDGLVLRLNDNGQSFFYSEDSGGFVSDIERAKVFASMRDAHEARKIEESRDRQLDVVGMVVRDA